MIPKDVFIRDSWLGDCRRLLHPRPTPLWYLAIKYQQNSVFPWIVFLECPYVGLLEQLESSHYPQIKSWQMTVRTKKENSGFHSNIKTDHFGGKDGQIMFSVVQVNLPLVLEKNQKCFHENAVFHQEAITAGNKGGKHFYGSYLLHTSVLTR